MCRSALVRSSAESSTAGDEPDPELRGGRGGLATPSTVSWSVSASSSTPAAAAAATTSAGASAPSE